jgi:hypothetical protein
MQIALLFCRLSTELHTGSLPGRSYFHRTSGDIWILDAHDWWRSFRLSSAKVVGGILIGYKMFSKTLYSIFRWLISMSSLADDYFLSYELFVTWNQIFVFNITAVCINWCRGREHPISKKRSLVASNRTMDLGWEVDEGNKIDSLWELMKEIRWPCHAHDYTYWWKLVRLSLKPYLISRYHPS